SLSIVAGAVAVAATKLDTFPKSFVYTPPAVGACTMMLDPCTFGPPTFTLIVEYVPESRATSHLLSFAKPAIEGDAVPVLVLNASAVNLDSAVVFGEIQIGE